MTKNILFVTKAKDSIQGSLRNSINEANLNNGLNPDNITTIIIRPSVGNKITLKDGALDVQSNIKIINATGRKLTINTSGIQGLFHVYPLVKIFEINSSKDNEYNNCDLDSSNSDSDSDYDSDSSSNSNSNQIILSSGTSDFGGAIYISSLSNHLILRNVIIKNNSAINSGGGIFTLGSVSLFNSSIESNQAGSQGGGIWCAQNLNLYNSHITKNKVVIINSSSGGGGVYIDKGDCKLNNSSISCNEVLHINQSGGSGGGIIVMVGSIYIQNNSHIDNNSAYNSGGIQEGKGDIIITNHSTVNHNKSFNDINTNENAGGGGGITITLGTVYVSESEVSNNKTLGMYSGGIVTIIADVIINKNSKIEGNHNRGPGGGIAVNVGSISIDSSSVSDNEGASLGGGIVNFSPAPGFISINNSKVSNNTLTNAQTIATTIKVFFDIIIHSLASLISQASLNPVGTGGGQIIIDLIPEITGKILNIKNNLDNVNLPVHNLIGGGGIASLLKTPITVSNSQIDNNFSGKNVSSVNTPFDSYGGGLFGLESLIIVESSNISRNSSLSTGGGIYANTSLNVSNSNIFNNEIVLPVPPRPQRLGQVFYGAGIFNDSDGVLYLSNSNISNNSSRSGSKGGGIANRGKLSVFDSVIKNNVVTNDGGGIYSVPDFVNFGNVIKNNQPNDVSQSPH